MMLTATSVADPVRTWQAGAYLGGASTNVYNTGPCPVLVRAPSAPADECVSNPHYDGHGAVLGGYLRYRVLPWLQVEAELTYAQKGYTDGLNVTLHYIEAPLVVRFDPLPQSSPARVFVVGGVAPALLAACHASGPIFINDPPPHQEMYSGSCAVFPYLDWTPRPFDLGVVLGIGVGWQVDFGAFEIQAREERGVIDVDGWETSGKTVNQAMYVVAGFGRSL